MAEHSSIQILHVVQSLEVGGLENGVVNLINRLDESRFDHLVCCLSHGGKLIERIRSRRARIVELGLRTDRFRFPIIRLRRLMRQWMPDIVHTRGWSSIDAIFAARVAGVPRVIHGEHGREASDPQGLNPKRNLVRRAFSPMVDRFVSVSDDLKGWLTNTVGIAERKVVRIHNGVDIKQFAPEGREMARAMLGLHDQTVAIGIVGRLDPVKDHATLLQAFATIKQLDKPIRLIIVGAGPMRNAIESQAQHLGIADSVALLGERHDVASVMRAFDIFALSSIAEGISNTILEAMATGLPVVATKVGGNPELVQHEVNGRLVNVGDVPSMAAALQQYVDDTNLRREHGLNSRRRAEMSFSLDGMAARYEQLYCDVLKTNSRREAAVALP